MKALILSLLLLASCSATTAQTVKADISADLAQCKPEEQQLANQCLPLSAAYAICLAMNKGNTSACQDQEKAMVACGTASAISCGLGLIQKAATAQ